MDYLEQMQDLTLLLIEKASIMQKNRHSENFIKLIHLQMVDFAVTVQEISKTQLIKPVLEKSYKTQKSRHNEILNVYEKCLKHCFMDTESRNAFVSFTKDWSIKRKEIQMNYYKSLEVKI